MADKIIFWLVVMLVLVVGAIFATTIGGER